MSNAWKIRQLLIDFKYLKCKFFEIGVNSFIWQNFINERPPIYLNLETPEASNVCHELCKSSRNGFQFDWQVCQTTVLLFWR